MVTAIADDLHNYRTSSMSQSLGHTTHALTDDLKAITRLAAALAAALPDHPSQRPDPDQTQELSRQTLRLWRKVKTLTANGNKVPEPFAEQIDLEVMALCTTKADASTLERTAESAVQAAAQLLAFHSQALTNALPATTE